LGQFRNVYDSTALPSDWLSNCFIHLRYNYDLSPRWTLEVFAQAQYDEVQEIRIRLLSGVGPRGELVNHKRGTLYLGVPLRNPWSLCDRSPELHAALERLAQPLADGLVHLEPGRLRVTEAGRPFIRNVGMAFDARLWANQPEGQLFSMAI